MKQTTEKQAFTLIETLITITIFAMLAVTTTQIYTNASGMIRKIEIQEYVFTEADAAINKIISEVERGTIDYEEYYSRLIMTDFNYGQNYGQYGATFYNTGDGGPIGDIISGGDGICCDTGCGTEYFFTETSCADMDTDTYDSGTGQNPSDGVAVDDSNAFCVEEGDCADPEHGNQSELYLIDGSGKRKIIIALENKEDGIENTISMVVMEGVDIDGDNISDYWQCSSDYTCTATEDHVNPDGSSTNYAVPDPNDLTNEDSGDDNFQPITPNSINVTNLNFFILPLEDPYRAFAETDEAIQQHPQVNFSITVAPSESMTAGVLGEDWTISLNRTGLTAVFGVVPSEYKGVWRYS